MDGKNNLSGRTLIMNEKIDLFKKIIEDSNNIVFFGGAGVSTESGIPDFRSKDGLYNQKYKVIIFLMKILKNFINFIKRK